ncbi:uncharacterized protein LOC119385903 [Rhipicephalus sanguineus]|uniref:uncharacterized protein LOC119385903 n=1 Tax=Rhipicephalus sanguineus TaxID=34632 RepID=UPI0020C35E0A|nr:uncharacterized protein LOC119385903 [Rhipicephalus sanguineus]
MATAIRTCTAASGSPGARSHRLSALVKTVRPRFRIGRAVESTRTACLLRFRLRVGSSSSLRGRCALVPASPARNNRQDFRESSFLRCGGRQAAGIAGEQRGQRAETSRAAEPHLARVCTVLALPQESAEFDSACLFEEHPPFKEAGRGAAGATGGRRGEDSDNYDCVLFLGIPRIEV